MGRKKKKGRLARSMQALPLSQALNTFINSDIGRIIIAEALTSAARSLVQNYPRAAVATAGAGAAGAARGVAHVATEAVSDAARGVAGAASNVVSHAARRIGVVPGGGEDQETEDRADRNGAGQGSADDRGSESRPDEAGPVHVLAAMLEGFAHKIASGGSDDRDVPKRKGDSPKKRKKKRKGR